MYVCMEPIATVINQLVHCIKWASWSIPQLPVAQVNNKTVQIVCIESNAHCIKESNYIDLLNQECRLKPGTNSGASFRKPEFCLGSANLWLCEKYSGSAIELGVHLLGFLWKTFQQFELSFPQLLTQSVLPCLYLLFLQETPLIWSSWISITLSAIKFCFD